MTTTRLLIALALCALGCGGRDDDLTRPVEWLGQPVALGKRLMLVDRAAPRALLIDVGEDELADTPVTADLPHDPRLIEKRNGADEALVLCMGRRATAGEDAEPAALAVVRSDGEVRSYELGSNPFDALVQSDDGRYAFLFKRANDEERLIDNPNEVAIIDLAERPSSRSAIATRTLRSFGDSPLAVVFSPEMTIVGEERRLAVVLSRTNVTLIDLDHPERVETTVQLSSADGEAIAPTEVLFNTDAPEIYVRGQSSDDVFVFNLGERPDAEAEAEDGLEHNDFRPFIDQLGVGGRPTDMALYDSESGTRLLVLADSSRAAVVEPGSSQVTTVTLPEAANRALPFTAASPRDRELTARALLYREKGDAIMFLDLEDLEARGSRNLELLRLPAPVDKVVPMLKEQRVLILHAERNASLVDLAGRTISPITSNTALGNAQFDEARRAFWVAPSGQPYVGVLDLATGDTREVLLDENVAAFVPMFARGYVAVLHDSPVGWLTVLDAADPARQTARSVRGFLVSDLLEGGE